MNLVNYFRRKKTASLAKDRLHIIIAQERSQSSTPDYLPMLRQELIAVVAKYVKIDLENIQVDLHSKDNNSVLELNIVLPETEPVPA